MSIRVVVAEDSITTREALAELLARDADIEVVGLASNGREALELARDLRPALVVMDIDMPVMDGFEATKYIMRDHPTPILIVTGSFDPRDVAITLQATNAGALAVLPKPGGDERTPEVAKFLRTVKALADVPVVTRRWGHARQPRQRQAPTPDRRPDVIGVGASTGGPLAIARFLGALPPALPVPVLVVQHIADGFAPGLARFLEGETALPVHLAEPGEPLLAGVVYLAPDGRHLQADTGPIVSCTDGPEERGFRPSVDILFESLVRVFGAAVAAVVLTGMGSDGLRGAGAVRQAGGVVLAQDEQTSTVFGMPAAVAKAGLVNFAGTAEELAAYVYQASTTTGTPEEPIHGT